MSLAIFATLLAVSLPVQERTVDLTPIAKVELPALDEMSGIVKSRRFPNTYWVHNDSGDAARIFAIQPTGDVLFKGWENRKADAGKTPDAKPYEGISILGAFNQDWEDIAIDGDTLYLSDLGNNANARRDLGIYVVDEPNPLEAREAHLISRIPVRYPEQTDFPPKAGYRYDCEGIFVKAGKLYIVTKERTPGGKLPVDTTVLYRLDSRRTDAVNPLKRLGERKGLGGWVTSSDLSPNGKYLALLTQAPFASVWIFDASGPDSQWLNKPIRQIRLNKAQQCEAIGFEDDRTVLISNEQREIFRVRVD
ncbi:hypothetical protein MCEMSE15_02444 [Fimbriimonadaceae bacterium]